MTAVTYQFQEHSSYPLTLLAKVPEDIRRQPVYNEYSQGGPLVMLGIRPYIDGRADMYGDDFTFRSRAINRGDMIKFREDVARYGIRWAVVEYDDGIKPKLVVALGATAAGALLRRHVAVQSERGTVLEASAPGDAACLITVHPAYLLRLPDAEKAAAYCAFVADLTLAGGYLAGDGAERDAAS